MSRGDTIEPICYQVWFSVNTVHGSMLEFVLDDADSRAKRPTRAKLHPSARTFTSYTEALWDMLAAEFKKAKAVRVLEKQEYGDVSFLIETDTPKTLEQAYRRSAKVVQRWINKYRINGMKGIP
jgi:hypothetical protein